MSTCDTKACSATQCKVTVNETVATTQVSKQQTRMCDHYSSAETVAAAACLLCSLQWAPLLADQHQRRLLDISVGAETAEAPLQDGQRWNYYQYHMLCAHSTDIHCSCYKVRCHNALLSITLMNNRYTCEAAWALKQYTFSVCVEAVVEHCCGDSTAAATLSALHLNTCCLHTTPSICTAAVVPYNTVSIRKRVATSTC
jgi:hypothetical protein